MHKAIAPVVRMLCDKTRPYGTGPKTPAQVRRDRKILRLLRETKTSVYISDSPREYVYSETTGDWQEITGGVNATGAVEVFFENTDERRIYLYPAEEIERRAVELIHEAFHTTQDVKASLPMNVKHHEQRELQARRFAQKWAEDYSLNKDNYDDFRSDEQIKQLVSEHYDRPGIRLKYQKRVRSIEIEERVVDAFGEDRLAKDGDRYSATDEVWPTAEKVDPKMFDCECVR